MKLVGCGHAKWIQAYREETGFPGEVFSDPERHLFKALGIHEVTSGRENLQGSSEYTGGLVMGSVYSTKIAFTEGSESGHWNQQGAAFVLGPGALCHYAHFEKFPQDHPLIEDIFRAAGAMIASATEQKEAPKTEGDK